MAVTLYLVGSLAQRLFGWPAPVVMLFLAVLAEARPRRSRPSCEAGAFVVYQFFSTAVTYPLLFAIGVAMTPWDKLMAAFNLPNLITIVATVSTLMGTGFAGRPLVGMYPIEAAIVNACHSRPGRHRRRGHPDGRQPHAADALRPDRHPHRRGDHGDLCLIAMAKLVWSEQYESDPNGRDIIY